MIRSPLMGLFAMSSLAFIPAASAQELVWDA